MKISACDVCLTDGKIVKAGWVSRLKTGIETIRLNICSAHKGMKLSKEKMLEIGQQAEFRFCQIKG